MTVPANDLDSVIGSDWQKSVERRRSEISHRIAGRTDVLLFGAGALGKQVRHDLLGLPLTPRVFVDNRPDIWGSEIDGLEVLSPEDAARRFGQKALWLITIYTNSGVKEQCRVLGVP